MPGIEYFKRPSSTSYKDNLILSTASIPVIEAGVANIKLAVFSVVCRRVAAKRQYDAKCGIALAHAVKCALFGESADPIRLDSVVENAQNVLEAEIDATLGNKSLGAIIALAYAAEIIALGWRAGSPGGAVGASLAIVNRAGTYGVEIPNITELWGASAINTFFVTSVNFLQSSVDVATL